MWRRVALPMAGLAAGGMLLKRELDSRVPAQAQALFIQIPPPPENLYKWKFNVDRPFWTTPLKVNRLARQLMAEKKKASEKLDDLVKQAARNKKGGPPVDWPGNRLAYLRALRVPAPPPDPSFLETYRAIEQLVAPAP